MTDRYDTSGSLEGQYEPGSSDSVLRNKLGITDPDEIADRELMLLRSLQAQLLETIGASQRITVTNLLQWHRDWLGSVYEWAGRYRTVNMQIDDFPFAAANRVPDLMRAYDQTYLAKYTPCGAADGAQLAEALAICHVEFVVFHPFREGNGRLARVPATVMALQAGMPLLDFTQLVTRKQAYIKAIHAGHAGNYAPMQQMFMWVLAASA